MASTHLRAARNTTLSEAGSINRTDGQADGTTAFEVRVLAGVTKDEMMNFCDALKEYVRRSSSFTAA